MHPEVKDLHADSRAAVLENPRVASMLKWELVVVAGAVILAVGLLLLLVLA